MVNFKLTIDFKALANNIMAALVFCPLDTHVNKSKENLEILNYFILDEKNKIFQVISVYVPEKSMHVWWLYTECVTTEREMFLHEIVTNCIRAVLL